MTVRRPIRPTATQNEKLNPRLLNPTEPIVATTSVYGVSSILQTHLMLNRPWKEFEGRARAYYQAQAENPNVQGTGVKDQPWLRVSYSPDGHPGYYEYPLVSPLFIAALYASDETITKILSLCYRHPKEAKNAVHKLKALSLHDKGPIRSNQDLISREELQVAHRRLLLLLEPEAAYEAGGLEHLKYLYQHAGNVQGCLNIFKDFHLEISFKRYKYPVLSLYGIFCCRTVIRYQNAAITALEMAQARIVELIKKNPLEAALVPNLLDGYLFHKNHNELGVVAEYREHLEMVRKSLPKPEPEPTTLLRRTLKPH